MRPPGWPISRPEDDILDEHRYRDVRWKLSSHGCLHGAANGGAILLDTQQVSPDRISMCAGQVGTTVAPGDGQPDLAKR